ncbi:MAG: hypothetical protein AAB692_03925 [Patescibacteria group bacterium]
MSREPYTHVFADGTVPNTPITISTVSAFGLRDHNILGFVAFNLAVPGRPPLKYRFMMDLEKGCFIDLPRDQRRARLLKKHAPAVIAAINARLQGNY